MVLLISCATIYGFLIIILSRVINFNSMLFFRIYFFDLKKVTNEVVFFLIHPQERMNVSKKTNNKKKFQYNQFFVRLNGISSKSKYDHRIRSFIYHKT